MRALHIAGTVFASAAVVALAGCASSAGFTATGRVLVPADGNATKEASGYSSLDRGEDVLQPGDPCVPKGGYSDISGGAQIAVLSSTGETLAFGSLNEPEINESWAVCELTFSISGVPEQENDVYALRVGGSQRGNVNATQNDLTSGVTLTLGG